MRKIKYSSRNFLEFRTSLINYIEQYYPDLMTDFNDSSIGMLLVELNAAIGDNLSYHTDRVFQETQLSNAQMKSSVLDMARTFGLKIPGKRPSITIIDFSVIIDAKGDKFDVKYAPLIRRGSQVSGANKIFETVNDVDFASPFSSGGIANRTIIPNLDSNRNINNYTVTKREIVINGNTKIFSKNINGEKVDSFYEIALPDNDVISVDSVITTETSTTPNHNDFYDIDKRWFEVDSLAENKVFVENTNLISDNSGIKSGKWVNVKQKFLSEITDNGFTKLIFGSGHVDVDSLDDFGINAKLSDRIGDFINNTSLGVLPSSSDYIHIKYRVGGGSDSNIGPNILKDINTLDMFVNGPDAKKNRAVKQSLTVNNPIPAMGGKDEPSVDEIRYLIKYNYASQNRAVTIKDYKSRISLMPGEFGIPFRCNVYEQQNKIVIPIIGLDNKGRVTNTSTDTLKNNISEYLSDYRMVNDYVEIKDGKIFNIAFDVDLHVDKESPKSQIIGGVIDVIKGYMDINKHEMGSNIYMSQLLEKVNNVSGVLNVIDIKIFNKVGEGRYSINEVSQEYTNEETKQINLSDNFTLWGEPDSMFEIKYPEMDIRCRVK